MADILSFQARRHGRARRVRTPAPPRQHAGIRARASLFAVSCGVLLTTLSFALAMVMIAILFYDGTFIGAGANGLCFGADSCRQAGAMQFGQLAASQRHAIAGALVMLWMPGLMILGHVRGLFRLYAAGIVFAADNISQISRIGMWLIAYSGTPLLARRLLDAYRMFPTEPWFRIDEAAALVIGLSLLLVARILACGPEMEQRRDLFI